MIAATLRGLILICIGLSLLGCSSYRMAYNNLDRLMFGWVEDYVTLTADQRDELEPLVNQWHDQHRAEQLPRYHRLLVKIRTRIQAPPTDRVELQGWLDEADEGWLQLRSSVVPLAVALLDQIDASQQQRLLKQLRKDVESKRDDYQDRNASQQIDHRYDLYRKRLQRWIGPINDSQRQDLNRLVLELPDSEGLWLDYRSRWIAELEQVLRAKPDEQRFQQQLQALIITPSSLRGESLQAVIEQSRQRRLEYMVELINQLSASQKEHLLGELDDLIEDIEQLL
ncbi:MAG: DUF6279 family lipoprotein [Halopseudomonas sp.]